MRAPIVLRPIGAALGTWHGASSSRAMVLAARSTRRNTTMQAIDLVTAADLMETDVLAFRPGDSVEQALLELEDHGHGAAPVVDGGGRVRGVFSLSDAARLEAARLQRLPSGGEGATLIGNSAGDEVLETGQEDELLEMEGWNSDAGRGPTVGEWMSTEIVSVPPEAGLARVCAAMVDHRVHRVLVVERGRLRGIVSTMDVAACLAERL
jgi:CBS domain-containing protein